MHQTWRFKRVNGTAYPDSIASSLRDASGAEVARLEESSNDFESIALRDRQAPGMERVVVTPRGKAQERGRPGAD